MNDKKKHIIPEQPAEKPAPRYGFVTISEDEKLRDDIYRSDMEKLQLFTKMLRRNALLNKVSVTRAD